MMNFKVLTSSVVLSEEQKVAAQKLGISCDFLKILLSRGIEVSEIFDFLHPNIKNMQSPFDIDGMKEAAERIKLAVNRKERIVIYGDYDCDGICAASILMLYLKDKAKVDYFIPERSDGYGMSTANLDKVIRRHNPNLIVSVDCGITSASEVEYLRQKGIEIVITDHHEPQEVLPNCIVVDAKIAKKGFYEYCGAGVALRLVEAMAGIEEAKKYFDIAALATIADSVPLTKDNRIIVAVGLEMLNKASRQGIKFLYNKGKIDSHSIGFSIAPAINAAGRIGSAERAVGLFLEKDYFLLSTLVKELLDDNEKRKKICDQIVEEAKELLHQVDFSKTSVIVLCKEDWNGGILGLAANRLVNLFKRPVVLFTSAGDGVLKGSSRSVPSINFFDALCSLKDKGYYTSFGGHSQAAGVSIKADCLDEFVKDINEVVPYVYDDIMPEFDMVLPLDYKFEPFVKELEKLEPTGQGNPSAKILVSTNGVRFGNIKLKNHVKYTSGKFSLVGFYNFAHLVYTKDCKTDFEVTLAMNEFNNKVTPQGTIEKVLFDEVNLSADEAMCLNLHQLNHEDCTKTPEFASLDFLKKTLNESQAGTLLVCFSVEEYDNLCAKCDEVKKLPVFVGTTYDCNPENSVVICPLEDFDYRYFSTIVIAGDVLCKGYESYICEKAQKCVSLAGEISGISMGDNELRTVYSLIAKIVKIKKVETVRDLYFAVREQKVMPEYKFRLAFAIFEQLGLIKVTERAIVVENKAVKLTDSVIYRNLVK